MLSYFLYKTFIKIAGGKLFWYCCVKRVLTLALNLFQPILATNEGKSDLLAVNKNQSHDK